MVGSSPAHCTSPLAAVAASKHDSAVLLAYVDLANRGAGEVLVMPAWKELSLDKVIAFDLSLRGDFFASEVDHMLATKDRRSYLHSTAPAFLKALFLAPVAAV